MSVDSYTYISLSLSLYTYIYIYDVTVRGILDPQKVTPNLTSKYAPRFL